MQINIKYPPVEKRKFQRRKLINIVKWPMLFTAFLCPMLNFLIGGKAWSLVVLMALYMVWSLGISTDIVEYNRISQVIKTITCSCVMLIIIDVFLISGWAIEVVPIVCFCGLVVVAILLFTDIERQKQNMMPFILLMIICIVCSIVGLSIWHDENRWALAVMGLTAIFLFAACIITLGKDFLREIKRRFHVR